MHRHLTAVRTTPQLKRQICEKRTLCSLFLLTTDTYGLLTQRSSAFILSCCSNGALDPWAAGGVTCNISDSLIAVLIEDGAHHLDLRHKNPLDPPSVVQARNLEKYYISRWISEVKKQKKEKAKLRISDKGKFRSISIR